MAQIKSRSPASRFPAFTWLAASNLFAPASEQISLVAIPLVAVTLFEAGGAVTSIMQMLTTIPFLIFAIPFGLLIDRESAKSIVFAGELVRAVLLAGLLLVLVAGQASLPLLALLGMAGSIGTVAFTVGAPTIVPRLVPHAALSRANSNAGFRPIGAGVGALAYLTGGYELIMVASTIGLLAQAFVILCSPAVRLRETLHATVARTADV